MKNILYKKRQSIKNHRKVVSINEHSDEKDCVTHVRKSFSYIVSRTDNGKYEVEVPEIFIKKAFDTKQCKENFSFRVRGAFFIKQNIDIFKVDFCHTLKIELEWKNKAFSPKKSVTLT